MIMFIVNDNNISLVECNWIYLLKYSTYKNKTTQSLTLKKIYIYLITKQMLKIWSDVQLINSYYTIYTDL